MKKLSMFDLSNPLDEDQQLEFDAGGSSCSCSCRGSSSSSSNDSANNASNLVSCSCWAGSDPLAQFSYSLNSSGSSIFC